MARNLTSDMQLAVSADVVEPVFTVQMEFADGTLRLWTGYGDITLDGETYVGTGALLGIDKVEEGTDLRAIGNTYTLSGVPAELRSLALNASGNMQGGAVSLHLGLVAQNNPISPIPGLFELVADPYELSRARMDVMTIRNDGKSTTIQLSAESIMIDLERARTRNYTPEDQAVYFDGDTFFNYVTGLQDKSIPWGRS